MEVGTRVSLKVATKVFFRSKNTLKIEILRLIFWGRNGGGGLEDWDVYDKFGIITPSPAKYHVEVSAPFSMKAVTKACLRGKNSSENLDFQATFLKQKRRSATKKLEQL